ncbi:MAG TPA: orotate phosphoribosyltransferase [Euryarchaeota archaeon]|nr:orotate phosphoribosyltransferase [Euryarchaeota archaeon]
MLRDVMRSAGVVQYGDFVLASGRKSNYYVNVKKAYTDPDILREIAKEISKHIGDEKIAGMALGAVPIVVAVSLETGNSFVIIRKDKKEHGTQEKLEGDVRKGDRYVVVEDVATTGASALRVAELLREKQAEVVRVITVVDREEGARELLEQKGLEMRSLFTAKELVRYPQ